MSVDWRTSRINHRKFRRLFRSFETQYIRDLAQMYGLKSRTEEWDITRLKTRGIGEPVETTELAEERVARATKDIQNGKMKPLVVYENGDIADGNHRYEAYKRLGFVNVPVLVIRTRVGQNNDALDNFDERLRQEQENFYES